MKNFKFIYIILVVGLFLTGCGGEDPFSTVLDVEPPEHIKQLSVHCYISSHDNRIFASLTETRALLDETEGLEPVDNGVVSIYQDGEKLFDLEPYPDNYAYNYSYVSPDHIGVLSGEVELRASAPGYPELTAIQYFPTLVPLKDVEFEEEGTVSIDGEVMDRVSFTFVDPPDEENYYEIGLISVDSFCSDGEIYANSKYISTQDLNTQNSADWDALLLSDASFNGTEYTLVLGTNQNSNENLYINWKCISKEHYQYSRSLRAFSDTQDFGTFGEPVSIFSNVDNGIGIFSCVSGELVKISEASSQSDLNEMSYKVDDELDTNCDIQGYLQTEDDDSFSAYGFSATSSLNFYVATLEEGTFSFPNMTIFYRDLNTNENYNNFGQDNMSDAEITISFHDPVAQYVEGTFNGTLENFEGESVDLTEGVFKIYYSE